ncbi:polysaccharide deacetylase family protein [Aeromicrobium sp. UC242_57]|uniref:polysaccharide deacetylase family protein n=1 Tax=Aeromicrobium sp. UC242_57 TaxID=3374624 RepID=UPI00378D704B
MLRRCLSALVATILLITALTLSPATAAAAIRPIPPDLACRHGKVALTFDDGPHKTNTPRLLKVLRKQRAQATFFVTGQNAQRHPALLRQMVRDGHAVEVHSWDHPDLTSRPNRSVKRQLHLTKQAIRRAIRQSPTFYRPPYGATDKRVRKIARRYGLREVLWTVDTDDWRNRSTKQITRSALAGLRRHRENNILMHDAVGNSPRTIKAVPAIVKGARKKGYCVVPLEQMMALGTVSAGPQTFTEDADSAVVRVTFRLDGPVSAMGRSGSTARTAPQSPESTTVRCIIGCSCGGETGRPPSRCASSEIQPPISTSS